MYNIKKMLNEVLSQVQSFFLRNPSYFIVFTTGSLARKMKIFFLQNKQQATNALEEWKFKSSANIQI